MNRMLGASTAALLLAATLGAQTRTTLIFNSRYDPGESLDAGAKQALREFRTHDILAVTPGTGATAFPLQAKTHTAARWGDAQNDAKVNEFKTGIVSSALVGPFVKWDDKKNFDPRKIYWTVKIRATADATAYSVLKKDTMGNVVRHDMRTGDFVRIKDDGLAEFFITQDLIMKAAGMQTGSFVPGTVGICQDKNKNLYYISPHSLTNGGALAGGHWVANGGSRTFAYDAAVVKIPSTAITYDNATGNVKDVTAASAVLVFNEINGSATNLTTRDMIDNSKHIDDKGTHDNVTFWMTGLDTDPTTTATFKAWDGKDTPHLIFTIVRTPFNNFGSWKTTIFTTQPFNNILGDVATINGVLMGSKTVTQPADGKWMGLKDKVGSANAPILNGLQWVETQLKSTAPYGITAADTANADGIVTIGTDPTINLAFQGESALLPIAVTSVVQGVAQGKAQLGVDLGAFPPIAGRGSYFLPNSGFWIFFPPGGGGAPNGQLEYNFPTPNDTILKNTRLIWQAFFVIVGGKLGLTPPIQTDFR